jgi:hypothetical protein
MPGFDGTGPFGTGPVGWRRGFCGASYNRNIWFNPYLPYNAGYGRNYALGYGRGLGWGFGNGRGFGWGRGYRRGLEFTGGRGYGRRFW